MSISLSRLFRPLAIGAATAALGLGGVQAMEVPMNLHQVLLSALDDEYRAEATYQAVIDKHGEVRPFINIIQAEQRHSDMVAAELVRNGWEVPANPHLGKLEAPATVLEACQLGEQAEVENIALYDRLLPQVDDPQSKAVLERLQWASRENHLPAFQRCVARGGMPGMGGGRGRGAGGGWR